MTAAPASAATLPATEAGADARFSNTFLRLKKKLERGVGEAIGDYNMIGDGDTVFHGVSSHMPMIATLLAKKTHAPNAVHLNIPGGVDPVKPALREYTSAGGELWESACAKLPLMEVFDLSMRGGLDVAFLSGVQFDALGHVNASVIGDYHKPKVRLPG